MGRIAKLLDFVRVTRRGVPQSDAKSDLGGGETVNALHFSIPNVDARPLPGDYVLTSSLPQSGRYAAYGYQDPANQKEAEPGEHITYARDTNGAIVCRVWLRNTGEVTLYNDKAEMTLEPGGTVRGENENGSFVLEAGGNFVVNGATIDTAGNISTPGTLEAAEVTATDNNITLGTHDHGGAPPTPGT